jgi:hypothetical protein
MSSEGETGLGHVRYIAKEHMEKVRPGTGRETGLGHVRCDVLQSCVAYRL